MMQHGGNTDLPVAPVLRTRTAADKAAGTQESFKDSPLVLELNL